MARIRCTIEFAPGSYKIQGASTPAAFAIAHADRVIVSGTIKIRSGHLTTKRIHPLNRGRYILTITIGHGPNTKVLFRRKIVVG